MDKQTHNPQITPTVHYHSLALVDVLLSIILLICVCVTVAVIARNTRNHFGERGARLLFLFLFFFLPDDIALYLSFRSFQLTS